MTRWHLLTSISPLNPRGLLFTHSHRDTSLWFYFFSRNWFFFVLFCRLFSFSRFFFFHFKPIWSTSFLLFFFFIWFSIRTSTMQNPHSMMEFPSKIGYIIISSALVRIRFCCAGVFGDYGLIPKRQKLIPVTRPYGLAGCLPKKNMTHWPVN